MRIDEALKLEGRIVDCGCVFGGYYGYLKVLKRKPWRGEIEILALSGFPLPILGRFIYPIKKGTIRNFGHCNVNITDLIEIPGYQESMIKSFYITLESLKKIHMLDKNLQNRSIKAMEDNEWLINHPDYYGGYKKEDMPKLLAQDNEGK